MWCCRGSLLSIQRHNFQDNVEVWSRSYISVGRRVLIQYSNIVSMIFVNFEECLYLQRSFEEVSPRVRTLFRRSLWGTSVRIGLGRAYYYLHLVNHTLIMEQYASEFPYEYDFWRIFLRWLTLVVHRDIVLVASVDFRCISHFTVFCSPLSQYMWSESFRARQYPRPKTSFKRLLEFTTTWSFSTRSMSPSNCYVS